MENECKRELTCIGGSCAGQKVEVSYDIETGKFNMGLQYNIVRKSEGPKNIDFIHLWDKNDNYIQFHTYNITKYTISYSNNNIGEIWYLLYKEIQPEDSIPELSKYYYL